MSQSDYMNPQELVLSFRNPKGKKLETSRYVTDCTRRLDTNGPDRGFALASTHSSDDDDNIITKPLRS